jgi:hypothetical protein
VDRLKVWCAQTIVAAGKLSTNGARKALDAPNVARTKRSRRDSKTSKRPARY